MYLRILNKRYGFIDEKDSDILETDIKISKEDYEIYFSKIPSKNFKVKEIPETNIGLFGYLEEYEEINVIEPSTQDKLNANLLKQNAELKLEAEKQKALNSQMLLEIAKLKQGGAV